MDRRNLRGLVVPSPSLPVPEFDLVSAVSLHERYVAALRCGTFSEGRPLRALCAIGHFPSLRASLLAATFCHIPCIAV